MPSPYQMRQQVGRSNKLPDACTPALSCSWGAMLHSRSSHMAATAFWEGFLPRAWELTLCKLGPLLGC